MVIMDLDTLIENSGLLEMDSNDPENEIKEWGREDLCRTGDYCFKDGEGCEYLREKLYEEEFNN